VIWIAAYAFIYISLQKAGFYAKIPNQKSIFVKYCFTAAIEAIQSCVCVLRKMSGVCNNSLQN
jgi:hypothetical protein